MVGITQNLRTDFFKTYTSEYSVTSILHGYIDFTYFYLQNDYLKKHKLKLAIVLNHQQARFELWLLGQTKGVQVSYWEKLKSVKWVNENTMPEWSISEIVMLSEPDFDNPKKLFKSIHHSFRVLSKEIFDTLETYE